METTLMELVNNCNKSELFYSEEKTLENIDRASELERLGFKHLSQEIMDKVTLKNKLDEISKRGYVVITDEKIKAYLQRKAELYNNQREFNEIKLPNNSGGLLDYHHALQQLQQRLYQPFITLPYAMASELSADTVDRMNSIGTGRYVWEETKIEDYKTIPPADVLERLSTEKAIGLFDYYTIASVKEVPDPLLLGRLNGCNDRFFIAQWGKDITLDDII